MASITVADEVRDELRRYKAQDGLTYDEAIAKLLAQADWIDNADYLLDNIDKDDE